MAASSCGLKQKGTPSSSNRRPSWEGLSTRIIRLQELDGEKGVPSTVDATDLKIVCYYGSWATYRYGTGKFDVANIQADLCTHFIYTFVGISTAGEVVLLDEYNDIADNWGKNAFGHFNNLTNTNPTAKTLVAIGGWNEGSEKYSAVMNDDTLRATFVDNVVNFVIKYGFDGFDLDWEYPGLRGGASTDKEAFSKLLKELRPKFDELGLLLTAAVAAGAASVATAYDVPALSTYLDFINVMTYDLHGSWDGITGQNAPLYASSVDTTETELTLNVDYAIKNWINLGADPAKIVLGMGTYGRTFTLTDSSNNGVGAAVSDGGNAGPYTATSGFLGFNELCEKFSAGGWTIVWDDEQKTPYAYSGNQWVGYDNVESIKIKSEYIVANGLGGGMFWSLETDDFHGFCYGYSFPLISAVNKVFNGGGNEGKTTSTTIVAPTITSSSNDGGVNSTVASGVTSGVVSTDICSAEGYVRDSSNCQVFYYCSVTNGAYTHSKFTCSNGLYYDLASGVCNYEAQVEC
uniref:chitinase n=2 Tax=Timema TaxID=61471 RepID=A0A7R9FVF3_TIMSH|nr:unnamed protein product [Timema shepardi]CAD7574969.1 unnamed protein product [Timema californicum]